MREGVTQERKGQCSVPEAGQTTGETLSTPGQGYVDSQGLGVEHASPVLPEYPSNRPDNRGRPVQSPDKFGRIYRRGNSWWISYRRGGDEARESVARVLGKRPRECTHKDAESALDLRCGPIRNLSANTADDISVAMACGEVDSVRSPIIVSGRDLETLSSPIVYALFRAGRALYVGQSRYGISRPFWQRHEALSTVLRPDGTLRVGARDNLAIWPAATPEEAERLEAIAIRKLRPELNRRLNGHAAQ